MMYEPCMIEKVGKIGLCPKDADKHLDNSELVDLFTKG